MTAKEYLSQAFHLDNEIQVKLLQVQAYRDLATRTTSVISSTPRSDSPNLQMMASLVAKVVDKESEIDTAVDSLIALKTEIEGSIAKVRTPLYRQLLELRYLCFRTWEEVGEQLGCTDRHARRVHLLALEEFERDVRPSPCMSGSSVGL